MNQRTYYRTLNLLANAINAEPEPPRLRNAINAKPETSQLHNAIKAEPEPEPLRLRDDTQCSLSTRDHCRDVN